MDTTELDALTDKLCKTDDTSFPPEDKLVYYNIGYGILNGLIRAEQDEYYETEPTPITTVSGQRAYSIARDSVVNWVKVNYGAGFIPARFKSQEELLSQYGTELETVLSTWDSSDPIYWLEAAELNIVPAPSASQAGAGRLKYSTEPLQDPLAENDTPLLPGNTHQGLSAYAAISFLDEDDPLWKKAKRMWDEVVQLIQHASFPRARQESINSSVPEDYGDSY